MGRIEFYGSLWSGMGLFAGRFWSRFGPGMVFCGSLRAIYGLSDYSIICLSTRDMEQDMVRLPVLLAKSPFGALGPVSCQLVASCDRLLFSSFAKILSFVKAEVFRFFRIWIESGRAVASPSCSLRPYVRFSRIRPS